MSAPYKRKADDVDVYSKQKITKISDDFAEDNINNDEIGDSTPISFKVGFSIDVLALAQSVANKEHESLEYCIELVEEYKKFIVMKIYKNDLEDNLLAPSHKIDKVWQSHMLGAQSYRLFCTKVLGNGAYIYRNPGVGTDGKGSYYERLSNTLELYSTLFNSEPCDKFWSNEDMLDAEGDINVTIGSVFGGSVYHTKVNKNDPLRVLFFKYCSDMKVFSDSIRFLYDGRPVAGYDTPLMLDMKNGARIDII